MKQKYPSGRPACTLCDHRKQKEKKKLGRYSRVLSNEKENELVKRLRELDKIFYGLTETDFCQLDFKFPEVKHIPQPFKMNQAGEEWYYNFILRNIELSLRIPEPTTVARACEFNRPQVEVFSKNLKHILDVTGIQTSAKRPSKVIFVKGKK